MTHPNYGPSDAYTDDELANLRAHYAGEATMVSKNIGRVLRTIEDAGLMETSIVSILSDHGIFVGERGRTGKSRISPGIFDAFPQHTEISHLVWMMSIPGTEPGRFKNIVQPPDLMPTLLEACGLEIPGNVEGRSLMPILEEGQDPHQPEIAISTWTMPTHFSDELVFCRYPTVTDGEWTLVLQEPPDPEPPRLYHIAQDPTEKTDLIREETDVARDLFARMTSWLEQKGTPVEAIERLGKVQWPN
jgi:arylsulfatase A-like enzyme